MKAKSMRDVVQEMKRISDPREGRLDLEGVVASSEIASWSIETGFLASSEMTNGFVAGSSFSGLVASSVGIGI